MIVGRSAGDVVFELQLNSYVRSFRHVSTHLLMRGFEEVAARDALDAGRAHFGFDWMCDPTGFVFRATDGQNVFPMGSEVNLADDFVYSQRHLAAERSKLFMTVRTFIAHADEASTWRSRGAGSTEWKCGSTFLTNPASGFCPIRSTLDFRRLKDDKLSSDSVFQLLETTVSTCSLVI